MMMESGRLTAECRGCGKRITRLNEQWWEDENMIIVCAKVRLEEIGHGRLPDYVLHAPMPEGLRGAPS